MTHFEPVDDPVPAAIASRRSHYARILGLHVPWVVLAGLGMVGSYIFALYLYSRGRVFAPLTLGVASHITSGLATGTLLGLLRPARPLATALAGSVLGITLMVLVYVVPDDPAFGWQPAYAERPWLSVAKLYLASAAPALLATAVTVSNVNRPYRFARTWLLSFVVLGIAWLARNAYLALR